MLAVSTAWNVERCAGWAPAAAEWIALGCGHVLLDGPMLQSDAALAGRTVRNAKGSIVGLRVPASAVELDTGLVATDAGRRREALARVGRGISLADDARCGRVLLELGVPATLSHDELERVRLELRSAGPSEVLGARLRELLHRDESDRLRGVERVCRALHSLTRAHPDVEFALLPPGDPAALALPDELLHVFDELPGRRLAYWHHTARVAKLDRLGIVPAESWMACLGARTTGATLEDWSPTADGLPVGAGVVDWRRTSLTLPTTAVRVVSVSPSFPQPLVLDALRQARDV